MSFLRRGQGMLASSQAAKARRMAQNEKAKNIIAKNISSVAPMVRILRGRKRLSMGTRLSNVYTYRQYVDSSQLNFAGMASLAGFFNGQGHQFTIGMLPQINTFAALYDQYRIAKIEFRIIPRAISNVPLGGDEGAVSAGVKARIIYAIDYDDANLPTTYNQLREYGNAKTMDLQFGRSRTIIWTPTVSAEIFNSPVSTSYGSRRSPWLDIASTSVPHYGLKLGIEGTTINNQYTVDYEVRYLVQFKSVR